MPPQNEYRTGILRASAKKSKTENFVKNIEKRTKEQHEGMIQKIQTRPKSF